MSTGPRPPTIEQVLELARGFGFELTLEEAASHTRLIGGGMAAYRRIEELPEMKLPVKYPRSTGYRPRQDENPFNGWYWRTEIKGAESGPLKGARVAVKDNICVAGVPMMNGSQVLEGYVPDVDATVVARLLDAGATIVGKTNAEDCSFAGTGHTCALGPSQNPHKPTHSPGGSSSGSAVVLASGQVDLALGGDQGGSIRIPSSWSGTYGLKPTYGLAPYTGCMMFEMTLDHVGPMSNSTEGIARMLSVMAGPDPFDPRQRGVIPENYVTDYLPALDRGVRGMKIAIVKEGFGQEQWQDLGLLASEEVVDEKVMAAVRQLERLGAAVGEVSIPMHMIGPYIFKAIITEGAAQFMLKGNGNGTNWFGYYNTSLGDAFARGWRTRPNDLPHIVKALLITGEYMQTYYHGRYYSKAQNVRHLMTTAYNEVLDSYDLLVMPTVPFRATPIPAPDCTIEESSSWAGNMINNTCQADVTGHPAMSVPCGMVDGLPIGMMLIGRHFEDSSVIAASAAFEKAQNWREL